jgi:hypothetical protein
MLYMYNNGQYFAQKNEDYYFSSLELLLKILTNTSNIKDLLPCFSHSLNFLWHPFPPSYRHGRQYLLLFNQSIYKFDKGEYIAKMNILTQGLRRLKRMTPSVTGYHFRQLDKVIGAHGRFKSTCYMLKIIRPLRSSCHTVAINPIIHYINILITLKLGNSGKPCVDLCGIWTYTGRNQGNIQYPSLIHTTHWNTKSTPIRHQWTAQIIPRN